MQLTLNNVEVRSANPPHSQKPACNLELTLCVHGSSMYADSASCGLCTASGTTVVLHSEVVSNSL